MSNNISVYPQNISEADYKLMIANCPFGIIMLNMNLEVIFANSSCINMLRVNSIEEINKLHPISEKINNDDILEKLKTNIPVEYSFTLNSLIENHYNMSLVPISNGDGSISFIFGYITDVTKQKIEEKNIESLSFYDTLTGLYNRRYFEKESEKIAASSNAPIGIIFGDVNGLKLTNDVFGHFHGDNLLVSIANILTSSTRDVDIVSRFSGDEFVILLPDADTALLENTCNLINKKCKFYKYKYIKPSISLGYAIKEPGSGSLHDAILLSEENMYKDKASKSKQYKKEIIRSLRKTVEKIEFEGKEHVENLKKISLMLGRNVGLSENDLLRLSLLAELHDIGKISIDKRILNTQDKLTEEEWEAIKKHTENGYQIAQSSSELLPIAEEILSHHERWDGSGYPNGLKGDSIPILSRIFAIADSFVVMTTGTTYKNSINEFEALDKILKESGSQFDPDLVEAFSSILVYEKLWVL